MAVSEGVYVIREEAAELAGGVVVVCRGRRAWLPGRDAVEQWVLDKVEVSTQHCGREVDRGGVKGRAEGVADELGAVGPTGGWEVRVGEGDVVAPNPNIEELKTAATRGPMVGGCDQGRKAHDGHPVSHDLADGRRAGTMAPVGDGTGHAQISGRLTDKEVEAWLSARLRSCILQGH